MPSLAQGDIVESVDVDSYISDAAQALGQLPI